MSPKLANTRARNSARTIAALQGLIADSTKPAAMRKAATLRLSRLRAASAPAKPLTITTKTSTPVPTEKAVYEAVETFRALARQRSVLFRKRRRSEGERQILTRMTLLMPGAVPQGSDSKAWSDFVSRIDLLLEEIRSIKNL